MSHIDYEQVTAGPWEARGNSVYGPGDSWVCDTHVSDNDNRHKGWTVGHDWFAMAANDAKLIAALMNRAWDEQRTYVQYNRLMGLWEVYTDTGLAGSFTEWQEAYNLAYEIAYDV